MTGLDLGQLQALAAAVDTGSLEAAAQRLHVTPSAISQRLKALEQASGAVLLRRSRPVRATPAGEPLLRLARQVEALTADAVAELADVATPQVPLAVNGDSLNTWALPALSTVADRVSLALVREDQDRSARMLRDGTVMAAITTQRVPVQGCTVRRLGVMRYTATAAPAFRSRWFPAGPTAAALAVAPLVAFDADDDLQDAFLRNRGVDPSLPPRHLVPAAADFVEAVAAGWGWAMVPELQAERLPADALVRLDEHGGDLDVELCWQQWSLHTAALDLVADAVRAAAATALR